MSSSGRPSSSGAQLSAQKSTLSHPHGPFQLSQTDYSPALDPTSSLHDDVVRRRTYAASAHPLDQSPRTRHRNSNLPSSFEFPQVENGHTQVNSHSRRMSTQNVSYGRTTQPMRPSNLSHAAHHVKYASSPFPDQPQQVADSESTASTTAPSTVWDELDDIKSRIRKLELTGKLPPSSNAAMSNSYGERPTTATTTMTNVSTSPKRRHLGAPSPETSALVAPDVSDLHPLLHTAFARAKTTLNDGVNEALEATILDALTLASMMKSQEVQGTSVNGVDRRLRGKIDNICRNLMDLCVTLADDRPYSKETSPSAIPPTFQNSSPPVMRDISPDLRFQRANSEDPELRSSSRVMSRLEARRASLQASSLGHMQRDSSQEPPTPLASKLDRTTSALRRREGEGPTAVAKRPLSRANIEGGQNRSSVPSRFSREYVSNHPLPSHPHRSPSVQSSIPPRKSYFSTAFYSPNTPEHVQSGSRRRLEETTPPSSSEGARLIEARQRRLASLEKSTEIAQNRTSMG